MQTDLLSCPVCSIQYDKGTHLPKILPLCGHTICFTCLTKIFNGNKVCPLDRIGLGDLFRKSEHFTTNHILSQLIEQKSQGEYEACTTHKGKPKHFICVLDQCYVCDDCVAKKHKNHPIKSDEGLKKEAEVKKKRLESLINKFSGQRDDALSVIQDSKKSVAMIIAEEFDKVRILIKQKEREICEELECLFEDTTYEIESRFNEIQKDCQRKIADLDNQKNLLRFFKTFESIDKKRPVYEVTTSLKNLKAIEEQFSSHFLTFIKPLVSTIESTYLKITSFLTESIKEKEMKDQKKDFETLFKIRIEENCLEVCPRNVLEKPNDDRFFAPDLSKLKEVNRIEVKFNQGSLTKQHFHALNTIYAQCEKMLKVNLLFDTQQFTDKDFMCFCSTFSPTDKLKLLRLDLSTSQVSDLSMNKLIKDLLANMANLQIFELRLVDTKITDYSIKSLASHFIANAQNLSQFDIELCGTEITDGGIVELCKYLKILSQNMKSLRLGLSETKVTDESIITFAKENLTLMNNLEDLKLYLCNTQVTDQAFIAFSEGTANSLLNIKQLFLNLEGTDITDKSVSNLGYKLISNLVSLDDLTIVLNRTNITDLGLKSFCMSIAKITRQLRSLSLFLSDTQITSVSVTYFAKQILHRMSALKTFCLDLDQNQITEKSLQALCEGFKIILKTLNKFTLYLEGTGIPENAIESVIDLVDLPSMEDLEAFDIQFSGVSVNKEIITKLDIIKKELLQRVK